MAITNALLLFLYTTLVGWGVTLLYRYKRSNPVFWFLLFQWLIAAGTIGIVELDNPSDSLYVAMFFASLLAFLCGALIAFHVLGIRETYRAFWLRPVEGDALSTRIAVYLLVALSIVITAIYYRAVGYNLFLQLLLGHEIVDFKSARLAAYSGDDYFAPGYVNQFKNVLLPLGLSIIGAWVWLAGNLVKSRAIMLFGVPVALWALLGTGQRGFLVYAFGAFLFGLAAVTTFQLKKILAGLLILTVLFGVFSFHLGRIGELSVTSVLLQILARMFVDEQQGSLVGFRYVAEMDIAWFSKWGQGFLGLLPGHRGSTLDHDIFGLIHGTTRGTATLSTVASVFHNGGLLGVLSVYLIMGWTYMHLYRRFLRGRRTVLRCFAYGALFFYLAIFVAGTPVGLVNKGAVTLAIVLVIRKIRIFGTIRRDDYIPSACAPNQATSFG